jgi:iron complex outermembrane recepter protein
MNSHIKNIRSILLISTFILVSTTTVTANAQIEEILVTAEKRSESLQDVAIAVTAIQGEDLRSGNVYEPRDLFQRMPNVSLQSNSSAGQLQLGIRGISFATFSPIGVSR